MREFVVGFLSFYSLSLDMSSDVRSRVGCGALTVSLSLSFVLFRMRKLIVSRMSALIENIIVFDEHLRRERAMPVARRATKMWIFRTQSRKICARIVWTRKGEFYTVTFNMFIKLSIVTRNGTTKDSSSCLSISTEKETYFSATRIAHESAPNFISKKDMCAFLISCGEVVRGDDNESKDDDDKNRREKRRDYMKRKKTLLWILRCTRAILDECWNKHMYNSLEQLTKLLHHEDLEGI